MKSLNKQVITIIGAGSGMGQQLAIHCASRGAQLALSDTNMVDLRETAELVKRYGVKCKLTQAYISNQPARNRWVNWINIFFAKVNVFINNMRVIYNTKALLPFLNTSGHQHIVNLSSLKQKLIIKGVLKNQARALTTSDNNIIQRFLKRIINKVTPISSIRHNANIILSIFESRQ